MADLKGVNGDFAGRLNQLMQHCGGISIQSAYRSPEHQAQLWSAALKKYGSEAAARKWVAPPGKSNHGKGLAVDLGGNLACAHKNARQFGLHFPMGWEPWHIEPFGAVGEGGKQQAMSEGYTDPPDGHPAQPPNYVDALINMMSGGERDDMLQQSDPYAGEIGGVEKMPEVTEIEGGQPAPKSSAPGSVKEQMKAGFRRAGREDLAAMVDTPEFHKWIQQESSWRDLTSAANNQGKPNYGYFQLWAGHSWARPGLPADEQAFLAATKFKLTPDRIRGFASQISRGTYKGWG